MKIEQLITKLKKHKSARYFWSAIFFLMDSISLIFYKSHHPLISEKKKIIVIRLDEIGDFVLWLDSAKAYRTLFPPQAYEITLLGNTAWQDLARNLPFFDFFLFINPLKFLTNPLYRTLWLYRLSIKNFSILLQPRFSKQFLCEDAIVRASNAEERIGFEGNLDNITPWEKRLSNHWYTHVVKSSPLPKMELLRNAEFIKGLGVFEFTHSLPAIPEELNIHISKMRPINYYVLVPGAGQAYRMWPVKSFATLADLIHKTYNLPGIVCGAKKDYVTASSICSLSKAKLINMAGDTSLSELTTIIREAKFVISNETGAVHIAAAVNTPCICIMGGGHFGRFLPYDIDVPVGRNLPVPVYRKMDCFGCNWKSCECLTKGGPAQCIKVIQPAEVWDKVRSVLDMKSK